MTDIRAFRIQPAEAPRVDASSPVAERRPEPAPQPFGDFEREYYEGAARPRDAVDARVLEYLSMRLREGRCSVMSLDVFDTLLLRNEKCERRRFWEIAERWQQVAAVDGQTRVMDLYLARLRAAEICYSCGPVVAATQEGRVDSIIGVALSLCGLPQMLQPEFLAAELAYERENLVPNPLILALIDEHKRRGGRIVVLSDMYLSGEHIHGLLRDLGVGDVSEHIYSSADNVVNKRSGTIFGPAARALGAQPEDILHIGDNYQSDFAMPRQKGWAAQHLPIPFVEERLREEDMSDFDQAILRGEP